ncbi:MAG: serine/threonine-protein kinase [Polyangiaceae bacterium]
MASGGPDTESLRPLHADAAPSLPLGSVALGKYQVGRCIGRGGMGEVYEATHTALGSRVALKLPISRATTSSAAARLLREAQVAASLDPDRVVRVLDVGVLSDGRPVLVLERLEGCTLAERLEAGAPIQVGEAVDFTIGACLGLVEAHARAVVHRDIKPSNLFLAQKRDGTTTLKVLDFGVAALRASAEAGDVRLTDSQAPVGSPPYMAPEQVRGRDVDARTDVWGLGVTLFELLAKQRPFDGATPAAVAAAIVADPPAELRALRSEVPESLAAIVMRCLAKDPADRPQHALALALELAPFGSAASRAQIEAIERAASPTLESSGARPAKDPSSPTQEGATAERRPSSRSRLGLFGGATLAVVIVASIWTARTIGRGEPTTMSAVARPASTEAETALASAPVSAIASSSAALSAALPALITVASSGPAATPSASASAALTSPPSARRVERTPVTISSAPTSSASPPPPATTPRPIMDTRKF